VRTTLTILIFEDNLIWGPRLTKTAAAFGHQPVVLAKMPQTIPDGDAAILNLSSKTFQLDELVPLLRAKGIKMIAHAGHKEKELFELGKGLGCDVLATNGEITNKLDKILAEL
jgi:hypothetical protein